MLRKLAEFVVRRPKLVLLAVMVLLGVSGVFGSAVVDKLLVGGNNDPASESSQVDDLLNQKFPDGPNLIIQVIPHNGSLDGADVKNVTDMVRKAVEAEQGSTVTKTFEDPAATELRSKDGKPVSGLILVHVTGTENEAALRSDNIIDALPNDPNVDVRAGGDLGVSKEIGTKVKEGITLSESVALPVTFVILIVVFGGLVAAFLPVMVGVTSIIMTLGVLLLMTMWTDVSTHALTVSTAFGLGLSVDFGLLMVSRFREERDNGKEHHAAIIATVTSAGRTILFSAITVTLAMTGLLVFPMYFLRSVGMAASAVVMLSALSAIVVLPAFLVLLGKRIESLKVIRRKTSPSADSMFWRRFAEAVIKRPLLYAIPVVAALLALGIPFLHAQYATPDERALPSGSPSRVVSESLHEDFERDPSQKITLATRDNAAALKDLAAKVSALPNVDLVQGPIGVFQNGKPAGPVPSIKANAASTANVYINVSTDSDRAQQLVRDIRGMITNHEVEVGGPTATLIDSRKAISDKLPLAVGLIAGSTFILLFLFTGSVIVPIKALLLNVLALSGVLGVMVWVFQDGHLANLLGVTPQPLNLSMVVLLCTIAFSLSVDYEIFLLSRIKEARDSGLSNDAATVVGLGRVGRIISSAAMLLTITLFSFASGLSFMKMFGIGTALAVIIDATIIRAVIVPAFLKMAGDLNWWAPAPLRWLHSKIGISEAPSSNHGAAAPDVDPALARELAQVGHQQTMVCERVISPPRDVEVIPGRHLVANVNGTVIVVAHLDRAPLSQHSAAAQQLAALVDMVGRTEQKTLAGAFSELTRQTTFTRTLVDVGIIMPTAAGLEILVSGNVTVVLDDGVVQTVMRGRGRLVHKAVPVPAVAAFVSVDEAGRHPYTPTERNGIYSLTGGSTVPGQGAVMWCKPAAKTPARIPAVPPVALQRPAPVPFVAPAPAPIAVAPPRRWIVLDDNSRFEIDQDLLVGRDPDHASATKVGLRAVRIADPTGEMSRAHMEVRVFNGQVIITDRNSSNGSFVRGHGKGETKLAPWASAQWHQGTAVRIGGRTMRLEVVPAPAPQMRPRVDVPHAGGRQLGAGPVYAAACANPPRG
jgi:RND superfamily putative drug exporter